MSKFKCGDRVRVVANPFVWLENDATGTVLNEIDSDGDVRVEFDNAYIAEGYSAIDWVKSTHIVKISTRFDHETARSGKIDAIKALRAFVPDLTLREAKDIVESIGSVYGEDISDLRARNDKLTELLTALRADYNDLLAYVPTDKLIDLLRK